jgi:hypothetical protein
MMTCWMNTGTRVTASYTAMTLAGIALMIIPATCLNLSLDLAELMAFNVSTVTFMVGDVVSILGLHEVCHCLYCKMKGIEIMGGLAGFRDLGIKVNRNYRQGVRLSSLFCIPVTLAAGMLFLPLWTLLFNACFACVSCADDLTSFLRDYGR